MIVQEFLIINLIICIFIIVIIYFSGGLSAINKALSDSIDDYEKSILNNISGNVTKRKPSKSEWEKK